MAFEWDEDNEGHLARHGISRREAEEALSGLTVRVRRRTDSPDRIHLLGRTAGGRYLLVIVQEKGGDLIRPFTGWDMTPHERQQYGRYAREE